MRGGLLYYVYGGAIMYKKTWYSIAVDVKDYCKAHPTAMIPDDQNCAKLYNCTDGKHTECTYPDLYNLQTQMCQNFMTTRCDSRTEPQAPCMYHSLVI